MKKGIIVVCALLGAVLFSPSQASSGGMKVQGEDLPPPDGKRFWEYITEMNPYKGWDYWPNHVGMYPGKAPHGAFLVLYANATALNAAREGKPMPYGAILVKENYDKDKKTLLSITPMYKVKGYNPEADDWFWVKYDAEGNVVTEGKPKGCISCHEVVKDNGWIFTPAK